MELALNTWKSQLSRAGTGNYDVNPWHWAVKSAIHNQLSRAVYTKTKGPFRVILKISPHAGAQGRHRAVKATMEHIARAISA